MRSAGTAPTRAAQHVWHGRRYLPPLESLAAGLVELACDVRRYPDRLLGGVDPPDRSTCPGMVLGSADASLVAKR
jgi:hypothetical protein